MSKKYKELPAFETNEFKVGDRVRAYHSMGRVEGVILSMHKFTLNVGKNVNSGLDFNTYNFKQCRKLVEVELREFYICNEHIQNYSKEYLIGEEADLRGYTKVREVLED